MIFVVINNERNLSYISNITASNSMLIGYSIFLHLIFILHYVYNEAGTSLWTDLPKTIYIKKHDWKWWIKKQHAFQCRFCWNDTQDMAWSHFTDLTFLPAHPLPCFWGSWESVWSSGPILYAYLPKPASETSWSGWITHQVQWQYHKHYRKHQILQIISIQQILF